MSAQANVYHSPEDGFAISGRGLFYGTEAEAQSLLGPVVSLGGCRLTLESLSFYEAITKIGEIYPDSEKFKSPGRFAVKPLNPQEAYEAAGLIRDVPIGSVYASINLYSLGGKVSEKSPDETAYFYRNASYIILIQSVWEESQYALDNKRWVNRRFKYIKSITQGSYVNFPYGGLLDYLAATTETSRLGREKNFDRRMSSVFRKESAIVFRLGKDVKIFVIIIKQTYKLM